MIERDKMNSKKTSLIYFILVVVLSTIVSIAVGLEDLELKLFIIFGIFGIALAVAIILNPSFGAFVLIVAIFTNISRLVTDEGFPGIILPLAAIVSVGIIIHYFYNFRSNNGRKIISQINLFIFLYFLVLALSYFVSSDSDRALSQIIVMGKDIAILFCIVFAILQSKEWKQAIWIIIITTSFLCLLGLYQRITGNYSQTFFGLASVRFDDSLVGAEKIRLSGPINAPNLWGQVLVAVLTLAIYRIVDEPRSIIKFFFILVTGLYLFAILNTFSRGAYLAVLIVIVLIFFERRFNPLIVLTMIGVSLVVIIFAPSNYISRFESLFALSPENEYGIYEDSSFRGRSSEIQAGQEMFFDHPLLGIGTGNYENNYQEYAQKIGIEIRLEERQAHSLYVEILAETGILGALTFGGIIITLMAGLYQANKTAQEIEYLSSWRLWLTSIQFSIIAYLITSLFLHGAYIRYFWVLVALAIASIQITENIKNNPKLLYHVRKSFGSN